MYLSLYVSLIIVYILQDPQVAIYIDQPIRLMGLSCVKIYLSIYLSINESAWAYILDLHGMHVLAVLERWLPNIYTVHDVDHFRQVPLYIHATLW